VMVRPYREVGEWIQGGGLRETSTPPAMLRRCSGSKGEAFRGVPESPCLLGLGRIGETLRGILHPTTGDASQVFRVQR